MRKYRLIYSGLFLFTVLLLIVFGNKYLFAMMVIEIILPIVLYILLRIETRNMAISLDVSKGCVSGEKCPMYFGFHGRIPFTAMGIVNVEIEFTNALYGRSMTNELRIPGAHSKRKYEIDFTPISCGEEHIICKNITCYDVFGISSVRMKPLTEKVVVVMPKSVSMQLLDGTMPSGHLEGEQLDYQKKGNDTSEVFDMREYQDGDDVKSIHWKLSSKLDRLIVKEPGYSSHYDTIVLFDAGIGYKDVLCDERVISGAMDFAITFSRKLLEIQRPHYLASVMKDRFILGEIETIDDIVELVQNNMGVALPEHTGGALEHYLLNNMQGKFSKVLYIVNGEFPDKLYQMAGLMEITAICITDKKEEISTTEKGNTTLIEIPLNELYKRTHYIYV